MAITNTGIVERTITGVNDGSELFPDNTTSTATNTGIVERSLTGVNESELWLDTESTSVVNNTGIVERPITGVNESDPMFPNNTISNIINLAGNLLIALFEAFKTRVSAGGGTLDNEVGLDTGNFDDTTSLTMLPNAYKDGVLYSVLPEDGTGDFDVVRGSSATRVNAEGLIEDIRYTTGNLVDYSTLTPSSSVLTLNGDGKYVYDDSGDAFLTSPNITANVGDVFNVLVDVSVPSGGDANFRYTKGNAQTILFNYTDFPDGVTEFQATVTGSDGSLDRIFFPASLNDGESTLNRFEITKVVDATNIPRIDYTSGSPVLLLEPQSTNLIDYSEDFTASGWAMQGASIGLVSGQAPDGDTSVYELTSTSASSRLQRNISTLSINTEYSFSFYVKQTSSTTSVFSRVLSLTGGSGGSNLTTSSYQSELVTDEWVRITHTFTTDDTAGNYIIYPAFALTDTQTLQFWGAQLEEDTPPTSYIPTNGAIATRLRDLVTMAGDLSTFNTDEGVLFAEVTEITPFPSNNYISLNIGGSAGQQFNNSIALNFRNSDKRVKAEIRVGGSVVAQQDQNNLTLPIKAAVRYSASEMALYVNGGLIKTTKIPTAWFPSGTLTQVDFDRGGASFPFFGRSKGVRTYNTALTDAEMITLTS